MSSLLVVGSIAFDTIETRTERRERILGGSANFACAAASHFCRALEVGVVGSDYPEEWFETLRRAGVDTEGVARVEGESFFWAGRYSDDFSTRQTLETRLGVFEHFDPVLPESYRAPGIAFLGNIAPSLQRKVLDSLAPGTTTAMDTMNLWLDTARDEVLDLVSRVDILLVNDEEALQMTGRGSALAAARDLAVRGPRTVVVKRGGEGALLVHDDVPFLAPAYVLDDVVDPTGAGDCFAGAFLGSLAAERRIDGRAMHRAVLRGAAVASWKVERFEPASVLDMPGRDLVERFVFLRRLIEY